MIQSVDMEWVGWCCSNTNFSTVNNTFKKEYILK